MNYYQHIEQAIIFIENNLSLKIVLDDIAEAACLSKFHFHRMFSSPEAFTRLFKSVFNITPKKYRRVRIERIIYEKNSLGIVIYPILSKE